MRWLPTISCTSFSSSPSSPSSSCSDSSPASSPENHGKDRTILSQNDENRRSHRHNHLGLRNFTPRLSRPRRSRYQTDKELVAGKSAEDPADLSRSNSICDHTTSNLTVSVPKSPPASNSVPLPLPLPVPESDGEQRRLSPKRDSDKPESEAVSAYVNPFTSAFAAHDSRKTQEYGDSRSPPRVECQDVNRERNSRHVFRLNVPARSATSGPYASPVRSPQRKSDTDVLPMYSVYPLGNEVRSAPDMPMLDTPGLSPPTFCDVSAFSTDNCNTPLHSPPNRSPRRGIRSPNGSARSATSGPYASPVRSPQRKSDTDVLPMYSVYPLGNEVRSAPDMPMLDTPGLSPPTFCDVSAFSTDNCNTPLHSPPNRSPRRGIRSPNGSASPLHPLLSSGTASPLHPMMSSGTASPLHPMMSIEIPSTRHDGGPISSHRLPLPPGAALPSPSSTLSPVANRQESLPMNCKWQKGKLIGRGTFGSVYVASNRETGALCAMKEVEIFPDDPKCAECVKQLEQEIKILSQLKHPNIVQYYGSEIVEDRFYIYLEYVHPGSINRYVREHCGAMTESVVRNFTRHILCGLAYLHSTKTIHRDIKGANLLVDAMGVVKLADFGMSKHLTGQRADLSLKGSPYWMAPELMQAVLQKDNGSDQALAIDIWSLGCTIIEMFTGKPPWSEYEGAAALFKVMKDTPPIPDTLSPEGKDFLKCCFQRNPAARPTASMLLEHRFLQNPQHSGLLSSPRMKSMDLP